MSKTTFEELGLTFDFDEKCITCRDGSCHAVVRSKKDGMDYSVHISTDRELSFFEIYATDSPSISSDSEIHEIFNSEEDAVKFVCQNFDGFECF